MSEKPSRESPSETPDHLLAAELQSPLTYVDRLLQNNQQGQRPGSGADDLLLVMLDSLTDYIVEMVGMEAHGGSAQTAGQGQGQGRERDAGAAATGAAATGNREGEPRRRSSAFTLFGQMPESRRG
ncbi:PREDICTED: huntingtin-interacting protein M [Miniopterus natalensis]|uniref:huntingtin-interacting protein M n=1 Tax=Miniopterus natalensis TaxID=291302 RepID=UPI0007A6FD59|nr:PREDICTED: huntingtin-interacting protein M [Miniopterus natalensis]